MLDVGYWMLDVGCWMYKYDCDGGDDNNIPGTTTTSFLQVDGKLRKYHNKIIICHVDSIILINPTI